MTRLPPVFPQKFPGQTLLAFRRDPIAFLRHAASAHGDLVRLPFSWTPLYLVNDPDLIKEILVTRQKQFKKGRGLEQMKRILGEGLLTSESAHHLRQRRLIQPAFHRQKIAAFGTAMTDCAQQTQTPWKDGETRDLYEEMMHLTLAIVGKTLFGTDVKAEADEIGKALDEVIGLFHLLQLPFADLLEKLPLPSVRRFHAARERLNATVYRLIAEHRTAVAASEADQSDLLSMLLEARDEEDGGRMSDEQVRDEVLTIFLAGHETTANAMTWTWYLLSQNPEAETKFHVEIDAVLAGRTPTLDDLPNLTYTRRVFAESIRLYPPAWLMGRRLLTDYEVGEYVLPAQGIVLFSQAVMHRDPRFWTEPDRFDPERWTPEAEDARPKFAFFPFGGGPRVCVGDQYAWMEGILLLATLGQHWRFRLAPDQVVATEPIVTLRPRYGMRMTLARR